MAAPVHITEFVIPDPQYASHYSIQESLDGLDRILDHLRGADKISSKVDLHNPNICAVWNDYKTTRLRPYIGYPTHIFTNGADAVKEHLQAEFDRANKYLRDVAGVSPENTGFELSIHPHHHIVTGTVPIGFIYYAVQHPDVYKVQPRSP
jgi:hypothetical protein